ncbi:MAG: ABC transporter permease [Oscillospiraceae bacterium]
MMDTLKQSLRMAIKSISGNKLRAFLTMLGIIIGVMALVILVSLVNGATSTVTDTISSLGTNLLTVTVSDDKGQPISLSDLAEFSETDGVGQTAAWQSESAVGKYGSNAETVQLYGTTAAYYNIQGLNMLLGRYIKSADVENASSICVINENAAQELIGYSDCIGEEISINGIKFKVVGVLEDNDDSLTAVFSSNSLAVYIPYTSLVRLSSSVSSKITSFYVSAETGGTTAETESAMYSILYERFAQDEDAFEIDTQDALEDTMSSVTSILAILLGGIAGISLIVGGIGIMNIMLVTVTERTREIGIRKAIGASRGVILQQFLLESVVLCMLGCAIGIFLSWGTLRIISVVVASLDLTFKMNGAVVLIAVLFCFIIGVGFGLYPANKAAKMKPIDALHYGG